MKKKCVMKWGGVCSVLSLKILRIMRLTLFLLFISLTQAIAVNTYSQVTKISLEMRSSTVKDVLYEIESKSGFYFLFNSKLVDVERKVNIEVSNERVDRILDKLFDGYDVAYTVMEKHIIIQPSSATFPVEGKQQKNVSGKVTDSSGGPLPGVSVIVKGTTIGTVTNADGEFTLSVPPDAKILQFSFVGMKTQEIAAAGKTNFPVVMEEDAIGIEEVVAVGYGTMKKSDLTGAVGQVKESEIQRSSVTSIEQALQGKVAGVQISQNSGAPGSTMRVRIRGSNSISYGNSPLYVVDGVPINSSHSSGNISASSYFGKDQGTSPLAFINPNDIESVSILKDASSTAIYGARGANGVIVITTKGGIEGKTDISFDSYYGIQSVSKKIDLLNAKEWATLARTFWARYRGGALISRAYTEEQIAAMGEGTDWQDAIYRNAITQDYNLSLRGGNAKTKFLFSANYFDQEGIVINSRFRKGSARMNLDHVVNSKLSFGSTFTTSFIVDNPVANSTTGHLATSPVYSALLMVPALPVYNDDGTYATHREVWVNEGIFMKPYNQNPVQLANEMEYEKRNTRVLGDVFANYEILKDLILKVSFGADLTHTTVGTFIPSDLEISINSGTNGSAQYLQRNIVNWLHESTLSYSKGFAEKHNLNALLGFSLQEERGDYFSASNYDFYNNSTGYYELSSGNNPQTPDSYTYKWDIVSFLGRINYDYKQKYLLTLSARYDGSSRFGANNKFGFFPSGALAWRVNEEPFLANMDKLSNLKLRASVGRTGNQDIPMYKTIQSYNTGGKYIFGGEEVTSVVPGALVNDDLRWEKTNQYDVGLDFGFFANKLNFTADFYYKKTKDLLLNVEVPRQGGYSSALKNIGSVQNKGVELSANGALQLGNVDWDITGTFSINRNKVLKLSGSEKYFGSTVSSYFIQRNSGAVSVVKEGQPLGVFWGNIFDGLWQTQEEYENGHMSADSNTGQGFEIYRDIDGNEIFEEGLDETVVGNPNPDYEFSLTNEFSYKNFDLSFYLYGMQGNDVLNVNLIEGTTQVNGVNGYAIYKQAWDGEGTSNLIPKIDRSSTRSGTYPNRVATNYIEDGSFIRLQNVTFGYTFDTSGSKFFKKARVYLAGENLHVWTDYSGYDPEVNSLGNDNTVLGVDMYAYPRARTIRLGVQATF